MFLFNTVFCRTSLKRLVAGHTGSATSMFYVLVCTSNTFQTVVIMHCLASLEFDRRAMYFTVGQKSARRISLPSESNKSSKKDPSSPKSTTSMFVSKLLGTVEGWNCVQLIHNSIAIQTTTHKM